MPDKNLLKPLAIVFIGAFLGFFSVKWFDQSNSFQQDFASNAISKLDSEQYSKEFFEIKVSNKVIAPRNDEVSTLIFSIKAFKQFQGPLTYNWNLPENVKLVEGFQTAVIENFNVDQDAEFQIKVKGYSKEVKNYISISISGNILNRSVNRDILISSRPEDSYEYLVQESEKTVVPLKKKKTASLKKSVF